VARLLDDQEFPHAVVGALALHAYGHSRATFDLEKAGMLNWYDKLVAGL
jgi:hypothetical protein